MVTSALPWSRPCLGGGGGGFGGDGDGGGDGGDTGGDGGGGDGENLSKHLAVWMKLGAHTRGTSVPLDDCRRDGPPHGGVYPRVLPARLLRPGLSGLQHHM